MNRIVLALIFALGLQNLMAQPIAPPKKTLDEKYLEALGLMMSGKVPQATKDFEALLVEYPNQADVCYQLARLYDQAHDNNKALSMAKKSVANDPENRWYRIFLADILETNGKYAEAAAEYKTLIGKEDFKVELYTSYAYYLVKAGEDEKALKVYNEIETKIGLTEEVSYNKHRLYAEMGKTAQATA